MDVTFPSKNIHPCKPCVEERIPNPAPKGKEAKPKDKFIPPHGKAQGKKPHEKPLDKKYPGLFGKPIDSFIFRDIQSWLNKFPREHSKPSKNEKLINDLVYRFNNEERGEMLRLWFFDNINKGPLLKGK